MKHFIVITIILFLICSCSTKKNVKGSGDLDKSLVFVNIGVESRDGIAKLIRTVDKCSPKVIGLNAMFVNLSNSEKDSALVDAIRQAGNVVLSSVLSDGKLVNSDSVFIKASRSQGIVIYGNLEEKIYSYETFVSWNDQLIWSFPATIAADYDFDLSNKLMNETLGNDAYKISFYEKPIKTYNAADLASNFDCEIFHNKIVLMGYLGPSGEDKLPVAANEYDSVYNTLIIGSILTDILKNKFETAD